MVTEVDVYQEIRRLQLEGVVSKREAARRLGISRNTVKKYWDGDVVPWDKKPYTASFSCQFKMDLTIRIYIPVTTWLIASHESLGDRHHLTSGCYSFGNETPGTVPSVPFLIVSSVVRSYEPSLPVQMSHLVPVPN